MSKNVALIAALGFLSCAVSAGCCHLGNGRGGNCPSGSCAKYGHSPAEHAAAKDEYEEMAASHEEPVPGKKSKTACADGSCRH
jgi:hypothetical protein